MNFKMFKNEYVSKLKTFAPGALILLLLGALVYFIKLSAISADLDPAGFLETIRDLIRFTIIFGFIFVLAPVAYVWYIASKDESLFEPAEETSNTNKCPWQSKLVYKKAHIVNKACETISKGEFYVIRDNEKGLTLSQIELLANQDIITVHCKEYLTDFELFVLEQMDAKIDWRS